MSMITSILIGSAALTVVLLSSALLLFAHLTGRIGRSAALALLAAAAAVGFGLVAGATTDGFFIGRIAMPIGVSLIVAAAINGVLVILAPKAAATS
jgi:hypothetical protein